MSKWIEYIEKINHSDNDWKYEKRADICPLIEIGTCKDCKRYNRNEMFCTWHGGYLMQKCDPDFYCADFEKRGNEK